MIELENGLRLLLNKDDNSAAVTESPKVGGIILIPKFVEFESQNYSITSIQSFAFTNDNIDSIIFPEDSELTTFQTCSFNCANIKKLQIPSNLVNLENGWSLGVINLVDIEVSPNNKHFQYFDNTYLLGKSDEKSEIFDILHFARFDIEKAVIPPQIKVIKEYSFYNYNKLTSVIFPSNSKLQNIEENAFSSTPLKSIEFYDKKIEIKSNFFSSCHNLLVISFQNANNITLIDTDSIEEIPKETVIKVRRCTQLNGFEKYKDQIEFIEETDQAGNNIDEVDILMNHIRYLENRLKRYEEVIPFDFNSITKSQKEKENLKFFDDKDESHQVIQAKIGEGATSTVFKVFDRETSQVMCKKILKKAEFKDLQNIVKEVEVLHSIDHPSICKAIGINTQERVEQDRNNEELPKTTVAIFLEYLNYNLKECIENNVLNNTLKVRIAVEVAFGMSYIHSRGMIHRDLKIENIMLNDIFEAKIIDFGLVHVDGLLDSANSMTKGIGTLAYMSPEMANEEEYNEKTDVYSYGVVLFVLFTGHLPKQSIKDKLNNKPVLFPPPSSSMSLFCTELIKKCMSFEASKRPSFEEILNEMELNNFSLASEIDIMAVFNRYLFFESSKKCKMK